MLYGALIIMFLLFEPLGLYGIWVKFRNYWKGWPFSVLSRPTPTRTNHDQMGDT